MPKPAATYTIDSTPHTSVVVCNRCAWRAFAHTKPSAYRLVATHLRRVHNDARNAEYADRSARNYNRKVSQPTGDGAKVTA